MRSNIYLSFILGMLAGIIVIILLIKYCPETVRYTFLNLVDIEVEVSYE